MIKATVNYTLRVQIKGTDEEDLHKSIKQFEHALQYDTVIGQKRGIALGVMDETINIAKDRIIDVVVYNE